ncbi:MAG: redoxin domain-containing protein [Pseudomonadota bacterium]
MSRLLPGETPASDLAFDTVDGPRWSLSDAAASAPWQAVVVYRGLHCPLCKMQLTELGRKIEEFQKRDIAVAAVSMDSAERAAQSKADWKIDAFPLGYGLTEDQARSLGLYISAGINDKEPARFSEAGLFLFKAGKLHAAWVSSLPFARPKLDELLQGFDFVAANDYPARGELAA